MAFPTVESVTTTLSNSATTSHSIDLPATIDNGDLLVAICRIAGTVNSNPAGWDVLLSHTVSPIYIYKANGTEGGGSITIGTSSASTAAVKVIRISDWIGDINEVYRGTQASGSSSSPNPPSATTNEGTEDNLFIAAMVSANFGASVSSYPTNYTDGEFSINTSSVFNGVGVAFRELADETDDPGVFTMGGSVNWAANTIIVRPSSGAVVTPGLTTVPVTVHAPTIVTSYTLEVPLISAGVTVFNPTVSVAGQIMEIPFSSSLVSIFSPTITTSYTVEVPLVSGVVSVYAISAAYTQTLEVPLIGSVVSIFNHTVTAGDPVVAPAFITGLVDVFAPTVLPGGVVLEPSLVSTTVSIYAPALLQQQFVLPTLTTVPVVVYGPSIAVGGIAIEPPFVSDLVSVFGPSLRFAQTITVPLVGGLLSIYAPSTRVDFLQILPNTDDFSQVVPTGGGFVLIQ